MKTRIRELTIDSHSLTTGNRADLPISLRTTRSLLASLPACILASLTAIQLLTTPAWCLTSSAVKDLTCAGFRKGSELNCTAGEFTVGADFSAAPGTPPFCVAGQAFSFKVNLHLYGSNADRYNIGFFAGQQNNDPGLTTGGNICSVATFPTTPSPWLDLNGDACGDYLAGGDSTITVDEIKVICTGDSTGALQVPYLLTYSQNAGSVCTGAADVTSGSISKCNKGVSTVSGNVKVYSGAYIDVTKQTSPDKDNQSFGYTARGPAGSKVIALVDGVYTPASIDTATESVTVSLSDGQTARFLINALSTDQILTITEAATTGWEETAAISCSPVIGMPQITTDNTYRTISALLNTTNSAASCTVTNTKKPPILPLITILKSTNMASASPGQTIVYTVQVANSGTGAGTNVVLSDALSPYALFSLNSYGTGVPFSFSDGSPPCGLSIAPPEYSDNNGTSWIYTPVSGGGGAPQGYDANITNWRIPLRGTIRPGGSFSLNYQVAVK